MKPKNMSSSASPDRTDKKSESYNKSSNAKGSGQGIQFSDDKENDQSDQPALGIGDGIISGKKNKADQKTETNIAKANSLLDDLDREEKTGF